MLYVSGLGVVMFMETCARLFDAGLEVANGFNPCGESSSEVGLC